MLAFTRTMVRAVEIQLENRRDQRMEQHTASPTWLAHWRKRIWSALCAWLR
jgi:hypothetical protein